MTSRTSQTSQTSQISDPVALARSANAELDQAPAEQVLAWAARTFGSRWVVAASMGDTVLVHLASAVAPGVDVVFLDTGYHFPETLGTRDEVAYSYTVRMLTVVPEQSVAQQDAAHGPRLFERDPDLCCRLRKVEPLNRFLGGYDAWVTGVRRDDASTRATVPVVSWDEGRGKIKINPLARWTRQQAQDYAAKYGVVLNPLLNADYPSIGCAPCTRKVAPGASARSGRWPDSAKTECGIHW